MNGITKILSFVLICMSTVCAACSESDDTNDNTDWALENTQYVDSIATLAKDASSEWERYLAIGLDPDKEWSNEYYVYCKVLTAGNGIEHPAGNDNVWLNYSGRLINGTIFDATYSGELSPEHETPVETVLNECVTGFITAIQEMVTGDIWEVVIPANLGYGASAYGTVKASSTLIFTVNLVKFTHVGE